MTVTMENPGGRYACVCPPKELHDGARRGRAKEIRAQFDKMGFGLDAQLFIEDCGGLASEGSEMYNDGRVVVAFCGELTNKDYLAQKLFPEEPVEYSKNSAKLIGKLFEQLDDHPQGLVGKLRGTYSFVVFDIERVRMFAARDCSGPAPIYQSRLSDGTMVISNYMTPECDEQSEVPPGHYVYGARRCGLPQKFSQSKDELEQAQVDAKQAVSKALQGILTRSELQPRLHKSMKTRMAARRSQERERKSLEKKPATPAPPIVTVLSQTIHTEAQPRRKRHGNNNNSWRSDASLWWRKPKPLSAEASPFVMPAKQEEEKAVHTTAAKEEEEKPTETPQPKMAEPQKELIIEAVNQLHRIASSGKIQGLLKVQEQEITSGGGLRRTPSCGELQRVPSLLNNADLSSLAN
jgi:hypothetical protein